MSIVHAPDTEIAIHRRTRQHVGLDPEQPVWRLNPVSISRSIAPPVERCRRFRFVVRSFIAAITSQRYSISFRESLRGNPGPGDAGLCG